MCDFINSRTGNTVAMASSTIERRNFWRHPSSSFRPGSWRCLPRAYGPHEMCWFTSYESQAWTHRSCPGTGAKHLPHSQSEVRIPEAKCSRRVRLFMERELSLSIAGNSQTRCRSFREPPSDSHANPQFDHALLPLLSRWDLGFNPGRPTWISVRGTRSAVAFHLIPSTRVAVGVSGSGSSWSVRLHRQLFRYGWLWGACWASWTRAPSAGWSRIGSFLALHWPCLAWAWPLASMICAALYQCLRNCLLVFFSSTRSVICLKLCCHPVVFSICGNVLLL